MHSFITESMVERHFGLLVSAWMNQHSPRDAVTEWLCLRVKHG